jgi:hypothetical protein
MKENHIALVVLCAVVLGNTLLYIFKPLGENFFIIADLTVILFAFTAFVFGIRAYKLHGFRSMQGKALLFLSLGIFFWLLGESAWAVYEIILGIEAPMASFADLMWIIGYPLFAAGMYYEWKITKIPVIKNRKFLVALAGMAIFVVVSYYGIMPSLENQEISPLEKSVVIGYVIGDMVLLFECSAIIISFLGGKFAMSWIIITVSIIMMSLADIAYSYLGTAYETGNWIDLLWDFGYILLAYGFFYYRHSIQGELEKPRKGAGK